MKTDSLFYRLFESNSETFFLLLGMSVEEATESAAHYEYHALELKDTSQRVDGVFLPKEAVLPVCFLEVQFYPLPNVYAGLLAKVYTYLKRHDPTQPYCGVVLFANRGLEPKGLAPYQPLLDAGLVRPLYLEEIPEVANAPLGLSILYLIRQSEIQGPAAARSLIAKAKAEVGDEALRADLIELIETIVIYKLSHLSREEIQAMLQILDIRESRVYQEAMEEGEKKGMEKGEKKGMEKGFAIARLAAQKKSAAEIAAILKLDVELVRQVLANVGGN
ncbi:MAG: Rpn family recombination-promoting nuclease/putative transposase [Planctomycetes bacterium]|nr:Rpn family recombination-promoting nuclease/putative transposase [Planctomycetota bacterium]